MISMNRARKLLIVGAAVCVTPVATVTIAEAHSKHHSKIPQHNRGDHDRDNRGGPSDGDGNI